MFPMTPALVLFAIRSLVRVGGAGREAYEQKVRDQDIFVPDARTPVVSMDAQLFDIFEVKAPQRLADENDLGQYFDHNRRAKSDAARGRLVEEYLRLVGSAPGSPQADKSWAANRIGEEPGSRLLLAQWEEGRGPAHPGTRIAFALADVALEFVGAYPGVLGVGGNGEKLVSAITLNIRERLPDVDNPQQWSASDWNRYHFAERAAALLFRAGLQTVEENPSLVVSDAQYANLLGNVLTPLVDLYDERPSGAPMWAELRDTLVGPMASAALHTLAENQRAFLGRDFAENKALGALTRALLEAAADTSQTSITTLVERDGLIKIYQAAAGAVAANPQAFVGNDQTPELELARQMLRSVGSVLRDAPPPFDRALAADLAAAALRTTGRHAPALIEGSGPWSAVAQRAARQVAEGLAAGFEGKDNVAGALQAVLTREQAMGLVEIFLQQASTTPGMIVGAGASEELRALVAATARAMAQSGSELLAPEQWLEIAAVAAEAAAKNPARLVRLDVSDPGEQLLARVIGDLLGAAAEDFRAHGRAGGSVLFGNTLRAVIETTVRVAAGNAKRALDHHTRIPDFVAELNALAHSEQQPIGAEEWQWLYERYIARVLDTGELAELTADKLLDDLHGRQGA